MNIALWILQRPSGVIPQNRGAACTVLRRSRSRDQRRSRDRMMMQSTIVIWCGALITAMVAGRSAAPSAAESNPALQGA